MKRLALIPMIERLYRHLGITELISEAEVTLAFEQLEAGLLRIAVDVRTAKTRGVALADAVQDDVEYPHLCSAHAILGDLLAGSVPRELEQWVRRVQQMPVPPLAAKFRRALADMAAGHGPKADTAHFLLFEGVRIDLLFAKWRARGALEEVGVEEDAIDVIAEREVDCLIALVPHLPEGVDPFRAVKAAALRGLAEHAEELRRLLRGIDKDIVAGMADRARFARALHEIDAVDAVLLRNDVAPRLGEQQLSTKELRRTHPVLLGEHTPNALDQRLSRLRRRLDAHGPAALKPRTRPSLFQLITDLTGDHS